MISIQFITPDGNQSLSVPSLTLTLAQILRLNQIPVNSVSVYTEHQGELRLFTGLNILLRDLPRSINRLLIRPDRNISYSKLIQQKNLLTKKQDASSEYTFASPSLPGHRVHIEMTPNDCRDFASREVKKFLENHASNFRKENKIVVGVSGGGDSNTLIDSLLSSGLIERHQIVCAMMLGIPDWDKGKPRAEELCKKFEVELRFIEENEVNGLLGRSKNTDWVTDFEKTFPDADLEVLGTLAIRLSLQKVAKDVGASACIVGLNLEDLLAESFLQLMKGESPLPFPIRHLGSTPLWYPLYRCPKKILDGCYPKYSLQNYMDRYPSRMLGRAIPYYLAQMVHTLVPGTEFDFIDGLQRLSELGEGQLNADADLGIVTLGNVPLNVRKKWREFQGVVA